MRAGTRILVVEDDRRIARLIEMELTHRGAEILYAHDGESGLKAVVRFRPDAIVLDIRMPGLDGIGFLKALRRGGNDVPVIALTARDTLADKVHGLEYGADDYLTKPFEIEELWARLRALLRRSGGEETIRIADLEIDTLGRRVRRDGQEIELTAREFDLLEYLACNRRRVLSRDRILSEVWGEEPSAETKVVDVYVGYLRKKVDSLGEKPLIRTVRGAGFVLRED